jgi:hypothetical protein
MFSFFKKKSIPKSKIGDELLEYYKKFPVPSYPVVNIQKDIDIDSNANNLLVKYKKHPIIPTLGFGIFICGSLFYYYIIKQKK